MIDPIRTYHAIMLKTNNTPREERQGQKKRNSRHSVATLALLFSCFCCMMLLSDTLNIVILREPVARKAATNTTTTNNEFAASAKVGGGQGAIQQETKVTSKKRIRQISILGERHSGTRWTYEVRRRLTRYKHWFQYDDPSRFPHDTLVLTMVRNPYEWLKAMEEIPHHSPAHIRTHPNSTYETKGSGNDWRIFLTKPWTTERVGEDLLLYGNETCQEDFLYRDVVSCVTRPLPKSRYNHKIKYGEDVPFYEMRNDGSGEPYDNILEMRTDKIRNHLSVKNYEGVADLWVSRYEDLVKKGTQHLLDRIEALTGIKPNCQAYPPQTRRVNKRLLQITPGFAAHVREHLNWTVEGWIGYESELRGIATESLR